MQKLNLNNQNFINGFTLLELSIVLVIIGLIVGGVVAGRELIRNAEIHSLITQINSYETALASFRYKYDALPGDFDKAESYWTECVDLGANSCNGDNDGDVSPATREGLRFWQHLGLAEMIEGTYSGNSPDGFVFDVSDAGVDLPGTPMGGIILAGSRSNGVFASDVTGLFYEWYSSREAGLTGGVVRGQDARIIDSKMDDGFAQSGNIISLHAAGFGSALCQSSGTYNVDDDREACRMAFKYAD